MQGLSIITNPAQQAETTERAEWCAMAHTALNRGYGDDEPDYDDVPAYTDARPVASNPDQRHK